MVREEDENDFGPKKMTKKTIQASCRKNKLYTTPHLNNVLYLHYSGYNAIECLDEYVELKCLFLECNAISTISGLEHQAELRCLFLHNNLIKKMENLEHCKQLDTLNLSHNHITKVENCGSDILPVLNTLNLSNNCLKTADSVENLRQCEFVTVLDISHNRIEDISVVKILGGMKRLRVLTLTGNPIVNEIPSYRKTLILECKSLIYLDARPVSDKDRACAEAWKRGGYQEEQKEHQRWKKEEQRKMRRNINATLRLRHRGDGEPDLLKTSSDEEEDTGKPNEPLNAPNDLHGEQCTSNVEAWKEMEAFFKQHPDGNTPFPYERPMGLGEGSTVEERRVVGSEESKEHTKQPLVEELSAEQYALLKARKETLEGETSQGQPNKDASARDEICTPKESVEEKDEMAQANDETYDKFPVDPVDHEKHADLAEQRETESEGETTDSLPKTAPQPPLPIVTRKGKDSLIATAEKEETLNVVIESREISITMQPACSDAREDTCAPTSLLAGERKPSDATSIDYVTGSDSNSDPTLVTDCDAPRRRSIPYSSRTDTSDSEDMFDKIVPKKHRRLASTVRTDPSSNSSSSSSSGSESELAKSVRPVGSKLDRQDVVNEFIGGYARFFRSDDPARDSKGAGKGRPGKPARPQTAKSQRTDPLIYEGVLKAMEQSSNGAKIEQARQEKRGNEGKEGVYERLLKGHAAVDMALESQAISIGGREHSFNEYRLEVFRKDQEKLQTLIDRVTAQKDRYNAHIDSIHDQLANIMADYGQISEKLRKVDDMIQTIGDEVQREEQDEVLKEPTTVTTTTPVGESEPQLSVVERIVENMTREQVVHMEPAAAPSSDESDESPFENAPPFQEEEENEMVAGANDDPVSHIEIEEGITLDAPRRKPMPAEFGADPVYRKFIDIQHEIDKLTEDEIFYALSEAARELHGDEERETCLLHDSVDEYCARCDDVDAFRQCLNLNAHPIIQRFKRFIECQYETDTDSEDREQVRKLEQAYQRYERRLSNHLFDEYLILSRKASIATTNGGESSAAELELIEIGEPDAGEGASGLARRRSNAWGMRESFDGSAAVLTEHPAAAAAGGNRNIDAKPPKLDELEDEESKPEQGCPEAGKEDAQRDGEEVEN